MISFRDMTFCCTPTCENHCGRKLTPEIREAARKWWGSDDAPIAVAELCSSWELQRLATLKKQQEEKDIL